MKTQRLHLLDLIRGFLLLIMIFYHYTFNLSYFLNYSISMNSFPINIIPPIFSSLFLFVSGYSSNFSKNSTKRGFYVFFWALLITIITLLIIPEAPIYFGILHCIGIMMILSTPIKKMPSTYVLLLSFLFLSLGFLVRNFHLDTNLLLVLGITSNTFASLDYYPLIPHGAYFILGLFFGRKKTPDLLYKKIENKIGEALTFAGKNSLKVYLLHQPLFFVIYFIIKLL